MSEHSVIIVLSPSGTGIYGDGDGRAFQLLSGCRHRCHGAGIRRQWVKAKRGQGCRDARQGRDASLKRARRLHHRRVIVSRRNN